MTITYLIIIITLVLSAFFSGMEIAFVSSNKLKIFLDKEQGSITNKIVSKFTDKSTYFIISMLIGNNVALVIYGVAAGFTPTCLFLMPSIILGQKGNSGSAFGVIMTGRHLGVLAGPILLPQLLLVNEDWSMATLAFGLITLSASVIAIGLGLYIFNFQKNKT